MIRRTPILFVVSVLLIFGWLTIIEAAEVKITASDGAESDRFGCSVSISGDYVIVGAYGDDEGGYSDKGSAYIFKKPVTGWVEMTETIKLTASDGTTNDNFGCSISISGDYAIVGACGDDGSRGSAYIFFRDGENWSQQAKFTASDRAVGDAFGISVFISDNYAIVGADNWNNGSGKVYIFKKPADGWKDTTETVYLTASDGTYYENFGSSVSISGDYIIIGQKGDNNAEGSAYVFWRSGDTWTQQAKLTASDKWSNSEFGNSVSISGDFVIVGAWGNNGNKAYIFEKPENGWQNMTETAKLTASDGASGDRFGSSVSISGDYAIVGASGDDEGGYSDKGSAYIFSRSGGNWTQQVKLSASNGGENEYFGYSVSISGNYAIIGSYGDNSSAGTVYTFLYDESSWSQKCVQNATGGSSGDQFGFSVTICGNYAIVGADCDDVGDNTNQGSAYIYHSVDDLSLPVEMTSFTAESRSCGVLLEWMTESETENLGFIVQRQLRVAPEGVPDGTSYELPARMTRSGGRVSEWEEIASYTTSDVLAGHGSTSEAHEYAYTDATVVPGATYLYRLGDVDYSGKVTWHKEVEVKVEVEDGKVPVVFGLKPAYPNPFNPSVTIPYGLAENGQMSLKVYNLRGELVETLMSAYALKGAYSYNWQPQNLSAGIYIIRLQSGNQTNLQKVVFVK